MMQSIFHRQASIPSNQYSLSLMEIGESALKKSLNSEAFTVATFNWLFIANYYQTYQLTILTFRKRWLRICLTISAQRRPCCWESYGDYCECGGLTYLRPAASVCITEKAVKNKLVSILRSAAQVELKGVVPEDDEIWGYSAGELSNFIQHCLQPNSH